jgi:FkbM family methyltransferase
MKISKRFQMYTEKYGLIKGYFFHLKMKYVKEGIMDIPSVKYPVYFRPGTVDVYTIEEVFGRKEYDIDIKYTPEFIIDGGANIGFTSVFFANKYPKAEIVAIEPEGNNFRLLLKNIAKYPNIKPLKSGVWGKDALLEVKDNGYGLRGFMVQEVENETEQSINATSIKTLMQGNRLIDILKLDIEGSEKAVFEANPDEWLPYVKCLIIELHDRMVKGSSQAVFKALLKYNFSFSVKGENLVFINEDLVGVPN